MHLSIIDAVYCPKHDEIVSLAVCKKGPSSEGCPSYEGEIFRTDRVREIICNYEEKC